MPESIEPYISERTGMYYNSQSQIVYLNFTAVKAAFPTSSLPKNKDMPSIHVYQVWTSPVPEVPEGYYVDLTPLPVYNSSLGHWEIGYEFKILPAQATL